MEWGKIEYRLPNVRQKVIVYDKNKLKMLFAYRTDDSLQFAEWETGHILYAVTHWMPLPEMPKE